MSVGQELQGFLRMRMVQLGALVLLFALLGSFSIFTVHPTYDPDVWWHLKTGDWILQHHQVPHTGILSRTAADRPWVAYSWGYEVQLSLLYSMFGILGIGIHGLILTMAVIIVCYWSAYRLSRNFWASILITGVCCYSFVFMMMPRPVFFSMILFGIELTLLLEASNTGKIRALYYLPVLFFLWANLHIQFVYGLFVLGLFVAVRSGQQLFKTQLGKFRWIEPSAELPLSRLWGLFALCVVAGSIGPYGPRLYYVVFEYSHAKYTYTVITELLSPLFEEVDEYFEVLVAAAAFFALGWRKRIDPFKALLLVIASITAFRTFRDGWFLSMVSLAIIAGAFRTNEDSTEQVPAFTPLEMAMVGAATFCCLFLVALNANITATGMYRAAGKVYPTRAASFIRQNSLPGPMYNSFNWGGFLTWALPQYPVSGDGRNDLYGDELDKRLFGAEGGELPYSQEPIFTESRLILLDNDVPLARLLSVDPAFEMVYRDEQAVVFVRR